MPAGSRPTTRPRPPRRTRSRRRASRRRRPIWPSTLDASASTDSDGTIQSYAGTSATPGRRPARPLRTPMRRPGTKTITLTVTDDDGATDTVEPPGHGAGGERRADSRLRRDHRPPRPQRRRRRLRLIPTATIETYAWDFGDGTTGTGETADAHLHRGRDLRGHADRHRRRHGTSTLTKQVVATDPPNQAPVAAFTSTTTALVADVDASGSSDPDGTVSGLRLEVRDGRHRHGSDGVLHLPLGRDLRRRADGDRQRRGRPRRSRSR